MYAPSALQVRLRPWRLRVCSQQCDVKAWADSGGVSARSVVEQNWAPLGLQEGGYGSAAARQQAQKEADENLASHFVSVQSISDTTTLPQMLEELERHLNRAASLDALILQLR